MSISGQKLFPLSDSDAGNLCKQLGIALNNAAMYGMEHTVTAASKVSAFETIVSLHDIYGDIEFYLADEGLLVNGKAYSGPKGTSQTLSDLMRKGNILQFALCAPLERNDFNTFLTLLAAEPGSPLISQGVEEALAAARLKSIRVEKSVYARISAANDESAVSQGEVAAGKGKGSSGGGARIFDLDSEFSSLEEAFMLDSGESGGVEDGLAITAQATDYLERRNEIRRQHEALLNRVRSCGDDPQRLKRLQEQLLQCGFSEKEWNVLLAESGVKNKENPDVDVQALSSLIDRVGTMITPNADGSVDHPHVSDALDKIGRQVEQLIHRTKGEASSLAKHVEADKGTIAKIENEARAQGIGLELSREELLQSLAEINQELVQPLTTSSALLQLLSSGKTIPELSDSQREILSTAVEGMERLEHLVGYLQRISGLPTTLSPDQELLSDVYGKEEESRRS